MLTLVLVSALCSNTPQPFAIARPVAPIAITAPALAHGGHFIPPVLLPPSTFTPRGKFKPKGRGKGAPPTSAPGGPGGSGAPGAKPPGTGPAGGNGGAGGATTGGGSGPDPLGWQTWWWFNRHRYIALRDHLFKRDVITDDGRFQIGKGERFALGDDRRPDPDVLSGQVAPQLLAALEGEPTPEMSTAAMVALAKLGHAGHADAEQILEALRPFVKDSKVLVSETAVMAMGILGSPLALDDLEALLAGGSRGIKLAGAKVSTRVRALAAVGLGLVGESTPDLATRVRITGILAKVLDSGESFAQQDIPVAAVASLALVPLPETPVEAAILKAAQGDAPHAACNSRRAQVAFVRGIAEPKRQGERAVALRAHAVRALGHLVRDVDGPMRHDVLDLMNALLSARGGDTEQVQVAAIQMLGLLADCDGDKADKNSRKTILLQAKDGRPLIRRLARIAAGRVAPREGTGPKAGAGRRELQTSLERGLSRAKSREKAWCALSLGLICHGDLQAGRAPDAKLVRSLRTAGKKAKGPLDVGAYAIALGLARDSDALRILLERYESTSEENAGGQIALGLGLLGEGAAVEALLGSLSKSKNRPQRLLNTAIALGLLGERDAAPLLVGMVTEAGNITSQAAAAVALGWIGDGRCVAPLLLQVKGAARSDYSTAFAMVALGRIGSKRELPWNATMAEDVPYTSITSTLVDGRGGVLDVF